MVRVVLEVFDAYPAETLDGIWGCLYNNYRSVLESDGGSQYKTAHNNGRERARETGSSVDLELSRDLYNKARRTQGYKACYKLSIARFSVKKLFLVVEIQHFFLRGTDIWAGGSNNNKPIYSIDKFIVMLLAKWGGLSDDIQTTEQVTALSTPPTIQYKSWTRCRTCWTKRRIICWIWRWT